MLLFQKLLKTRGVKTIFDLDDPLFLPTGRLFGINLRPGSFCLEGMIKNADFVTVDNHHLLRYVNLLNQNTDLVHVPVNVDHFFPRSRKCSDKITIGWQGNPKAHYANLAMLVSPLEEIAQKYDVKFKIVSSLGDPTVKQMFRRLERRAEVDYGLDHWVPFLRFAELLSDFDIMLSPLVKTVWYEGKSALRVGLGMAMGLPVVASPVGEQKYVIKHGVNGFLAENDADWRVYLGQLIENGELRRAVGKEARVTAEKELSLNACGSRLFNIMRRVLECEQKV
jgi:glycosyltransferase involved in cell wall biosynthesis